MKTKYFPHSKRNLVHLVLIIFPSFHFKILLLLFSRNQLGKQSVNLTSLQILTDPAQEEVVPLIEVPQLLRLLCLAVRSHLGDEEGSPNGRAEELSQAVEKAEGGDSEEGDPPPPEDEEVVLVEQVVGENAEDAVFVRSPSDSSSVHKTGHLSGEDVTQGVDSPFNLLVVVEELLPVIPELSSEQRIHNAEADHDADSIENLTEKEAGAVHHGSTS